MKSNKQNLFVILGHFLPLYPPNSLKNENIKKKMKKMKKMPGDVTYQFSFELFFDLSPITLPPNSPENENFKKKEKSAWEYNHFTQVYLKS